MDGLNRNWVGFFLTTLRLTSLTDQRPAFCNHFEPESQFGTVYMRLTDQNVAKRPIFRLIMYMDCSVTKDIKCRHWFGL